jgi:hypothetical protein
MGESLRRFRRLPEYEPARRDTEVSSGLKRVAAGHAIRTAPTKRMRVSAEQEMDEMGCGADVGLMRGSTIVGRMSDFHRVLVESTMSPTPTQVTMQASVLRALAPLMYAGDWAVHKKAIKEHMRVTPESDRSVHVLECPRRFGKTLSSAQIAAMVLLSFEGIRMCVISTGDRVAGYFIQEVTNVLRQLSASGLGRPCKIEYTQKGIDVVFTDERGIKYRNTLLSVPAVVDSIRGITVQFWFADEANFMDPEIFYKIIFPLLKVGGTVLLCVSSPNSSSYGPSATLWNARMPNGELCVHRMNISLICEECNKRGMKDCPHNTHVVPQWHDAGVKGVIERLYANANGAYRQEIQGQMDAESIDAFDPVTFEHMAKPDHSAKWPSHIDVILVGFDPSGGGKLSNDAAAAVYLDNQTGKFIVSLILREAWAQYFHLCDHPHGIRVEFHVSRCTRYDIQLKPLGKIPHGAKRQTGRVRVEPLPHTVAKDDGPPHDHDHDGAGRPGHHHVLLDRAVAEPPQHVRERVRNRLAFFGERQLCQVLVCQVQRRSTSQNIEWVRWWRGLLTSRALVSHVRRPSRCMTVRPKVSRACRALRKEI